MTAQLRMMFQQERDDREKEMRKLLDERASHDREMKQLMQSFQVQQLEVVKRIEQMPPNYLLELEMEKDKARTMSKMQMADKNQK